jgi:F-type H+-transporting ATPase subunit gamma
METAISMSPVIARVVPVDTKPLTGILPEGLADAGMAIEKGAALDYHPNANAVFAFLIDTFLNAMLYGALVEAYACEQTARMTAMDNATKNAEEMIQIMTLKSNRARQSKITGELIEIVNGANQLL